jgi:hypothetical protein
VHRPHELATPHAERLADGAQVGNDHVAHGRVLDQFLSLRLALRENRERARALPEELALCACQLPIATRPRSELTSN